jgi:pumilio RNA-binding family
MVLDHIISDLLDYATNEQSFKSVTKAIKEGGQDLTNRFVKRMAEPAKGGRRAMIVDLALSTTGSQLIGVVLPTVSASGSLR